MEELRSTEILDKEIINDAHKKAERIEKRADDECAQIKASVAERVRAELDKTEENFKNKLDLFKRDLFASVPLEKERFFVSFVQDSIIKGINEYLSKLSDEKKLDLICSKCRKVNFDGKKLNAYVYGFSGKDTEKALKKVFGESLLNVFEVEFNTKIYEESFLENNQGVIIMSENEDIKCRFTLSEIMNEISDKYRNELYESLFDKGAE